VVSFQTPNCPLYFAADPETAMREDNALVAWTFREFLDKEDHKPERIVIWPMAKATFY